MCFKKNILLCIGLCSSMALECHCSSKTEDTQFLVGDVKVSHKAISAAIVREQLAKANSVNDETKKEEQEKEGWCCLQSESDIPHPLRREHPTYETIYQQP